MIIQDGRKAFIGSQSLRRLELDERREVGVVFTDPPVVKELIQTCESDWSETDAGKAAAEEQEKNAKKKKRQ